MAALGATASAVLCYEATGNQHTTSRSTNKTQELKWVLQEVTQLKSEVL